MNNLPKFLRTLFLLIVLGSLLVACGGSTTTTTTTSSGATATTAPVTLNVFAAASLTESFNALAPAISRHTPMSTSS